MNGDRIFYITYQAQDLIQTIRLLPVDWHVLLAISENGFMTGLELSKRLQLSTEGCSRILQKLEDLQLINEPELNLSEYNAYRLIGQSAPEKSAPPQPSSSQPVRFSLGRKKVSPKAPSDILQKTGETSLPDILELQPLLDFIRENAADGSLGQLSIYRLFIKIPKNLLESSGLSVIELDNTSAATQDPTLIRALLEATREITGRDYPSHRSSPPSSHSMSN